MTGDGKHFKKYWAKRANRNAQSRRLKKAWKSIKLRNNAVRLQKERWCNPEYRTNQYKKQQIELKTKKLKNGCIICISHAKNNLGYVILRREGGIISAHRYTYQKTYGKIPMGKMVLHSCDNASCINPGHLRLGTHKDNMRDVAQRERNIKKLKISQVKEIKLMTKIPHKIISKKYGISTSMVSRILGGQRRCL